MDPYDQLVCERKKKRNRYLIICASLLVILVIVCSVTASIVKRNDTKDNDNTHDFSRVSRTLKIICNYTSNPKQCEKSISSSPEYSDSMSIKDLLGLVVDVALNATDDAYSVITGMYNEVKDPAQKAALRDCVDLMDTTYDQLNTSSVAVHDFDIAALSEPSGDVQTWLSAAITNVDTCIDGFANTTSNDVKTRLNNVTSHVQELASNSLAIIVSISSLLGNKGTPPSRRLLSAVRIHDGTPKWLSVADRRLLQNEEVNPDVVVALDGSGKYKSIQKAIDAAPKNSKSRYVILVKNGTYTENVQVPKSATNIFLVGSGVESTVVTGNRNVIDGSTTFASATFATVGKGFMARDIAFENTAGPEKHQAVALRTGADKSVFYRCKMTGYQDTMYTHSLRQFYSSCEIWGTVDFIFGNSAVVFQNCVVLARQPSPGQSCTVTAQGRTDPNMNTGIVIHKSTITGAPDFNQTLTDTYLGRPWKEYSRTVIMGNFLGENIIPQGWMEWNGTFALETLVYREFNNTGPGSATGERVKWPGFKVITNPKEALKYTVNSFLGKSFVQSSGFSYEGGL